MLFSQVGYATICLGCAGALSRIDVYQSVEGEMDVALSVIKYVFVTTVMVGGVVVAAAIVRLAWEKARQPQATPKDDA